MREGVMCCGSDLSLNLQVNRAGRLPKFKSVAGNVAPRVQICDSTCTLCANTLAAIEGAWYRRPAVKSIGRSSTRGSRCWNSGPKCRLGLNLGGTENLAPSGIRLIWRTEHNR